ncbi:amidohydrolase [Bacillus tianshenii]|nr:amidohydrolase [Bacillus tianshenii]
MGKLWHNGVIYTMSKEGETVEAVFTEDGFIKAMGSYNELKETYQSEITDEVNLKGNVMYPGFVDSHMHLIGHGEKLIRLDLSKYQSSQEMKEALVQKVAETNEGEWIIGEGWNENVFPDRKIFHRLELDEIAPQNPMMLTRVCRHAILANTKALELAGITKDTPNPSGGVIVRDVDDQSTGYLLDQAQELVKAVIPEISTEELQRALQVSVEDLLRMGLVGSHTEDLNYYGGFKRTAESFFHVIDGEQVKYRAHLLVHHGVVEEFNEDREIQEMQNEFVEFGAMKIFSDGALGGRTALLSKPYNDVPEASGMAIHTVEKLEQLVQQARKFEMNVAIHAIGDLAAEYALAAMEKFPPVNSGRDRLIHAQIMRPDLIEKAKKMPVIFDIQPTFTSSDFPWVIERLGEHRMTYSYAWRTLLTEGIHCAGGSDAPIEEADPLLGIFASVTRAHPDTPWHTYGQEQCLTMFEAVQLFTIGSAYAINREHERGLIKEGYVADFTVLDQDLFQIQYRDILQTNVKMTVVDGDVMYEDK